MTAMASALTRQRVLSGIQPTAASFQLGNYLGALRHWVQLQDEYDSFFCVVDQHAITAEHDPVELRARTLSSFAQTIAAGVDPTRSTLFVQSQVPEHAQLAWVLSCLTGYGEAARMTQFKDKSARDGSGAASVGLFTYPILMAADILVYRATKVPVGEDQRQHLELTRTLAQRFNTRFGDTFNIPGALLLSETAKILDLQDPGSKMSKSAPAGCVFLLDDARVITKKIKSAVTDSDTQVRFDPETKPGVSNLLTILSALSGISVEQLERSYEGVMYGRLKADVADVVVEFTTAYRQRTAELLADPGELARLMAIGAQAARAVAAETLREVYQRIGFVPLPVS